VFAQQIERVKHGAHSNDPGCCRVETMRPRKLTTGSVDKDVVRMEPGRRIRSWYDISGLSDAIVRTKLDRGATG
jgi:hypothetical protein